MADNEQVTRRHFLCGATATIAGISLFDSGTISQERETGLIKALNDPNIVHGLVRFRSGTETVDGYLSHPKAAGRYSVVIVVPGNTISEEYIANTTAILAQAGFVGLAPNIFSLQTDSMSPEQKREVFTTKITDEHVFGDIQAGIDYLKEQPFVEHGRIGIAGFCFGGRVALLFAARSDQVGAVVPFYGTLRLPAEANHPLSPLDVANRIKAPVQGHYALKDSGIRQSDVQELFKILRSQDTPAELYNYDAEHGFFAYTRPVYNDAAAKLSRNRMLDFFKRYLK